MKQKRIFSFDFIRVLAMVMIVVFHYNAFMIDSKVQAEPILFIQYANGTMAHIGVSLFFILSGASLMYSYGDGLDLKTYFKKRFLSIYPLYWITYAAFFLHFYVINHTPMAISRKTLILSFLGMDGYLYYRIPNYYLVGEWFVGCIIIIYFLFPLLRRLVLRWPAATAAVTVLLYIPYLHFYPFMMEDQRFFLTRIPEVMLGMYFITHVYKAAGLSKAEGGFKKINWQTGLLSLAAFLAVLYVPIPLPMPYLIIWAGGASFLFLAWVSQFLEWNWLMSIFKATSACSFAIFLVHHILMGIFIAPYAGTSLDFQADHLLFFKYFVITCMTGFVFYQLSLIFNRIISPLMKRI